MVHTVSFGFNTKRIKCVNKVYDNIPLQGIFKLPSAIYFQNMCNVTCDIIRNKTEAHCFAF